VEQQHQQQVRRDWLVVVVAGMGQNQATGSKDLYMVASCLYHQNSLVFKGNHRTVGISRPIGWWVGW